MDRLETILCKILPIFFLVTTALLITLHALLVHAQEVTYYELNIVIVIDNYFNSTNYS